MMNNKLTITVYNDFRKDHLNINAWSSPKSFSIDSIDDLNYDVKQFGVIEVSCHGTQGDNSKFDSICRDFQFFPFQFLNKVNNKLLFSVSRVDIKNRIRSYKGIFPKAVVNIQKEFDVKNGYSAIAGIVEVDDQNFYQISGNLFDRSHNFMLISNTRMYSDRFIQDVYDFTVDKRSSIIDYVKLCSKYCNDDNIIVRETGDGADQLFSWQFFHNKKYQNELIEYLRSIM